MRRKVKRLLVDDLKSAYKCFTVYVSSAVFVLASAYNHLPALQTLLSNNFGIEGNTKWLQGFAVAVIAARMLQSSMVARQERHRASSDACKHTGGDVTINIDANSEDVDNENEIVDNSEDDQTGN